MRSTDVLGATSTICMYKIHDKKILPPGMHTINTPKYCTQTNTDCNVHPPGTPLKHLYKSRNVTSFRAKDSVSTLLASPPGPHLHTAAFMARLSVYPCNIHATQAFPSHPRVAKLSIHLVLCGGAYEITRPTDLDHKEANRKQAERPLFETHIGTCYQ